MKKTLLSLAVATSTFAASGATYNGQLQGMLGNMIQADAVVTVDDNGDGTSTVTILEFETDVMGINSTIGPVMFENVTTTTSDGVVSYAGSCEDLQIGRVYQYNLKITMNMEGTENNGQLTLNYTGTGSMAGQTLDGYFTFKGNLEGASSEDPLPEGVYFKEDFEWMAPWAEVGNGKPCGSTVEDDNPDANAPQMATPKVDGVSAYQALLNKGYTILATHASSKSERKPEAQTYLQSNYLKFGLTGYYSGIVMPVKNEVPSDEEITISFDWCSMRQASGKWDPTELVVIVTTDGVDHAYAVDAWNFENGAAYKWTNEKISVPAGVLKSGSTVTMRNADSQWPVAGSAPALRWMLDNIVIGKSEIFAGVGSVEADADNDSMPVEYYNLQGIRMNGENLPAGLYIRRQGSKTEKILVR